MASRSLEVGGVVSGFDAPARSADAAGAEAAPGPGEVSQSAGPEPVDESDGEEGRVAVAGGVPWVAAPASRAEPRPPRTPEVEELEVAGFEVSAGVGAVRGFCAVPASDVEEAARAEVAEVEDVGADVVAGDAELGGGVVDDVDPDTGIADDVDVDAGVADVAVLGVVDPDVVDPGRADPDGAGGDIAEPDLEGTEVVEPNGWEVGALDPGAVGFCAAALDIVDPGAPGPVVA